MPKTFAVRALVALLLLIAGSAHATQDFLRFMQENAWQVVDKPAGFASEFGNFEHENYLVRDPNGNEFILTLFEKTETLRILASHELAEAIGLPHFPVYPVLVRRGDNNIPTEAELESGAAKSRLFDPNDSDDRTYSRFYGDIIYISALLFPRVPHLEPPKDPVTPEEISLALKNVLFRIAIGAQGLHYGTMPNDKQRFISAINILSQDVSELTWQDFKISMKYVPYQNLQALGKDEAKMVTDDIGDFLDRLEWMAKHHLETIFAPPTTILNDEFGLKYAFTRNIKARIMKLRELTARQFRERIGKNFNVDLRKKALPYEVLYTPPRIGRIRFPGDIPKWPKKKLDRQARARDLLEAYYLSPSRRQMEMVLQWGENDQDPIEPLLEDAAKWDGSVRLINHRALPTDESHLAEVKTEPQVFLNRNLPKALVVLSPMDQESAEALRILEELKGQIPLEPYPVKLRPGQRIGWSRLNALREYAVDKGFKHIIFGEIVGVDLDLRTPFTSAGITLEFIDHHHEDGVAEWHPFSWLEQLMDRLNYFPDIRQKLKGMQDRMGLHAFKMVNWNRTNVKDYMHRFRRSLRELVDPVEGAYDSDQDVVLLIESPQGDFAELSYALNWETFPRVANALVQRERSLVFFGRADLAFELHDALKAEGVTRLVWGGDIGSTIFVIARLKDDFENIETLGFRWKRKIMRKELMASACAIEVANQAAPSPIWNSASGRPAPSSRSSSRK